MEYKKELLMLFLALVSYELTNVSGQSSDLPVCDYLMETAVINHVNANNNMFFFAAPPPFVPGIYFTLISSVTTYTPDEAITVTLTPYNTGSGRITTLMIQAFDVNNVDNNNPIGVWTEDESGFSSNCGSAKTNAIFDYTSGTTEVRYYQFFARTITDISFEFRATVKVTDGSIENFYFGITSETVSPAAPANICTTNPCMSGGTCTQISLTSFSCQCPSGFSGEVCQNTVATDVCSSSPCQNGGTCFESLDGEYYCDCPTTHTGSTCEGPPNACSGVDCQNGGICSSMTGVCTCINGYSGIHCQIPDPCNLIVCFNGGTCLEGSCSCANGYTGVYCEMSPDPCSLVVCQNFGLCSGGICNCVNGYTGTFCEIPPGPCYGVICQNGGACSSGVCSCINGYTGTLCENPPGPCYGVFCQNNGACSDGVCSCIPGYTGTLCEIPPGPCYGVTCQNNGACSDGVCSCIPGYTGTLCEIPPNPCDDIVCQNGGVCSEGTCSCDNDYTGIYCEVPPNPCDEIVCQNGGVCSEGTCSCDNDYTGVYQKPIRVRPSYLTEMFHFIILPANIDVDPCQPNPCGNGGCFQGVSGSSFVCSCPDGSFLDDLACPDVPPPNPCNGIVCENGGECVEGSCSCDNGYTGANCEIPPNICNGIVCENGGVCVGGSCNCADGYTGTNCDTNIDVNPCQPNPCGNGGCFQGVSGISFVCSCPDGTFLDGLACPDDPCDDNPCENGECTVSDDSFVCTCSDGWFKEDDSEICNIQDMCNPNLCQNDGECQQKGNQVTCNCTTGWSGTYCEIVTCDSASFSCNGGGECKESRIGPFCICKDGYRGSRCETGPCDINPCLNGGECILDESIPGTGYRCECQERDGYYGNNCQNDRCTDYDCSGNNGDCQLVNFQPMCNCQPGYSGIRCQISVCEDVCFNGGSCVISSRGEWSCRCVPGYRGSTCREEVNECASNPCRQGTCHDRVGSYDCICPEERYGTNCEKMNYCLVQDNACNEEGTMRCIALDDDKLCVCKDGYSGFTCSQIADRCLNNPCGNNGLCRATDDGIACDCNTGFHGDFCELQDGIECASNPCMEGGTCTEGTGKYECTCVEGRIGINCELVDYCGLASDDDTCMEVGTKQCISIRSKNLCVCNDGYRGNTCTEEVAKGNVPSNDKQTGPLSHLPIDIWWLILICIIAMLFILFIVIVIYTRWKNKKYEQEKMPYHK
ncbi:uncharacterized protein [Amphiura filiformis]|uniref:uncharacterized protein n=1 Tax=Amphiura filiformis TaxID=82378 RepID=UPI003B20D01B